MDHIHTYIHTYIHIRLLHRMTERIRTRPRYKQNTNKNYGVKNSNKTRLRACIKAKSGHFEHTLSQ